MGPICHALGGVKGRVMTREAFFVAEPTSYKRCVTFFFLGFYIERKVTVVGRPLLASKAPRNHVGEMDGGAS